jgi:hypothetical protein
MSKFQTIRAVRVRFVVGASCCRVNGISQLEDFPDLERVFVLQLIQKRKNKLFSPTADKSIYQQ